MRLVDLVNRQGLLGRCERRRLRGLGRRWDEFTDRRRPAKASGGGHDADGDRSSCRTRADETRTLQGETRHDLISAETVLSAR
jgi:hypothetical protein